MLSAHPWEFDAEQRPPPLGRLSRSGTYVGIRQSPARLAALLGKYSFPRAIDLARQLDPQRQLLRTFSLVPHTFTDGDGATTP
jgi:hypothetical protein